ncbi:hypothetical protein Tco_1128535 [Tanacetum coccineum]
MSSSKASIGTLSLGPIRGDYRTMSLLELGWRVGLYSEDFTSDDQNRWIFQNALTVKRERDWKGFWLNIGNGGFVVGSTVVNNIRDPKVWLDHRCLAMTILGHKSSTQRITAIDMFYLYYIYTKGVVCNIPHCSMGGNYFCPTTQGVGDDDEEEEVAEAEAEEPTEAYRDISQGDWQERQGRWMDQHDER